MATPPSVAEFADEEEAGLDHDDEAEAAPKEHGRIDHSSFEQLAENAQITITSFNI